MKCLKLSVLLILLSFKLFGNVEALYQERLDKSLSYRQAALQLDEARLKLRQQDQFFIPYVQLNSVLAEERGISIFNDDFQPITINAKLSFSNVFGTDISIALPYNYKWDPEERSGFDFPILTVSRKIFEETKTQLLKAQSEVLDKEYQLEQIKSSIWIDLIDEIFDYNYYLRSKELYQTHIQTLDDLLKATRDEETLRSLKRQWYSIQKSLLETEDSMKELKAGYQISPLEVESLYKEIISTADRWKELLPKPNTIPTERKDIQAVELSMKAAEKEANFWILPYLPNPALSASLSYDLTDKAPVWSISMQFSLEVVDRGERSVESRIRRQGKTIEKLRLEEAKIELIRSVEKSWNRIDILSIDQEIKKLDLEDAGDALTEAEELHKKGFITKESLSLKELDFEMVELSLEKTRQQFHIEVLELLKQYNIKQIGRELYEK